MKILKILLGTLVVAIVSIYVVLFTSLNKTLIVPLLEGEIVKISKIKNSKISEFDLSFSSLNIKLSLDKQIIDIDTTFDILSEKLNLNYKININDLSKFNYLSGQKLNGTFTTQGNLKGIFDNLKLIGDAKVANGDIQYRLNINKNDINNIKININSLKLSELLYIINQPRYAKANLNSNITINSLDTLNGQIDTELKNGLLNKQLIKKYFGIKLPKKATFSLKALTKLDDNIISTQSKIKTFAAKIDTKKTIFDISTATLNTDYILTIPKLSKLYFITNQKMRGDIKIDGDLKFKDYLIASFNLNKFNGNLKGTLIKDDLKVMIKDIDSLKLLNMLYYPELYTSKINLDLDYNLKTKQGVSYLIMNDGKFLTNQLSKTIKKYIKKDLTQEIYKVAKIKTKIDNKKLNSNLYMKSKNSKIVSDKTLIDLNKNTINSDINMNYYKYELGINLSKSLNNPKVKIDTSKLIKSKIKYKVNKIIQKKLGDKLLKDLNKNIGGFLNKLF